MGPSIKYVTLFWTNFDPLPYHTLSHISGPPKVRHTFRNPKFLVVHAYIHVGYISCLYREDCLSSRGFLSGGFGPGFFCLEGFVRGGFVRPIFSHFCQKTSVTTES